METKDKVFGETPLITAAKNGHIDKVRSLLAAGADKEATDKWGRTALMWAAREGYPESLAALIEAGAVVDTTDKHGNTAFTWAQESGHDSCAQKLVDADAKFVYSSNEGGYNTQTVYMHDRLDPKIQLAKLFPPDKPSPLSDKAAKRAEQIPQGVTMHVEDKDNVFTVGA